MTSLRTYTTLASAHAAQARLEAEGIPVFLKNAETVGMAPLYSHALGGVQLQVPADRAAEALDLLGPEEPDTPVREHPATRSMRTWTLAFFVLLPVALILCLRLGRAGLALAVLLLAVMAAWALRAICARYFGKA